MPTLVLMTWIKKKSLKHRIARAGFTLIEILVVVTIMVLIVGFAVPSMNTYFQISIQSASKEIASIAKEAFYHSLLTKTTTRLVYDIENNTFWVESTKKDILLQTKENMKELERQGKIRAKDSKDDVPIVEDFELEPSLTRRKIALPAGVSFENILTEESDDPIEEGIVFTHFFSSGFAERAIVHLKDTSSNKVSLVLSSTIGATEVYDRYIQREEAYPSF